MGERENRTRLIRLVHLMRWRVNNSLEEAAMYRAAGYAKGEARAAADAAEWKIMADYLQHDLASTGPVPLWMALPAARSTTLHCY